MFKVNREKLYTDLEKICDVGIDLLEKETFDAKDFNKLKTMRSMGSFFNARIAVLQQENATERLELVRARMKELGYEPPAQVTG